MLLLGGHSYLMRNLGGGAGAEALRAAAARGTDMSGAEMEAALQDPTILRFLGKLQHADEWARSIEVSAGVAVQDEYCIADRGALQSRTLQQGKLISDKPAMLQQLMLVCLLHAMSCHVRYASATAEAAMSGFTRVTITWVVCLLVAGQRLDNNSASVLTQSHLCCHCRRATMTRRLDGRLWRGSGTRSGWHSVLCGL